MLTEYFIRRFLQLLVVIFVVSILIFVMMRLIPADAAVIFAGTEATQETVDAVRRELGLDQPVYVQYFLWLKKVLSGDLGKSFHSKQPVLDLFLGKLPATLILTGAGITLALAIAFPLGIISGTRPQSWVDSAASALSILGIAMPAFWLGALLILFFATDLGWFPAGGFVSPAESLGQSLKHLVLPALTIGLHFAAAETRFLRSGMLDVMSADYIRTARAKGLRERVVVMRHALKNALITMVTVVAMDIGALIGGAIVTETVFFWPGIGTLLVSSISRRDYPVVQAVVLFTVIVYVTVNFLADLCYAYLDPRIRYN